MAERQLRGPRASGGGPRHGRTRHEGQSGRIVRKGQRSRSFARNRAARWLGDRRRRRDACPPLFLVCLLSAAFSALAIPLPAHLDVYAPFDSLFDLLERIYPDAVTPASNGDEHASVLHDDDALEAHAADEGIRVRCRRGNNREDIEAL